MGRGGRWIGIWMLSLRLLGFELWLGAWEVYLEEWYVFAR